MHVRLKDATNNDRNVNMALVREFKVNPNGEGSVLIWNDGSESVVLDSTRSIRGYVKKALGTNSFDEA